MLKRKSKIAAVLILGLSLSAGTAVHASTLSNVSAANASPQVDQKMHKCKEGRGAIHKVLRDKLGVSDADIENAVKSGKTAFDLAKVKGYTSDQLREMIVEEKYKKIDEGVKEGKITKEKADTIKADFKIKIQKWDGSLKHKKKHGVKHKAVYSVLKNKLGYTDSDIEKAIKDGKSAFDLASAKKVTNDQFKAMVVEEQSKRIDDAVTKGKITNEKGDSMKANFRTRVEKWDGSLQDKGSKSKES